MKKVQRIDRLYEVLRVFLGIVIAYSICLVIIVLISGSEAWRTALYNFCYRPIHQPAQVRSSPVTYGAVHAYRLRYVLRLRQRSFQHDRGRYY